MAAKVEDVAGCGGVLSRSVPPPALSNPDGSWPRPLMGGKGKGVLAEESRGKVRSTTKQQQKFNVLYNVGRGFLFHILKAEIGRVPTGGLADCVGVCHTKCTRVHNLQAHAWQRPPT